MSATGYAGGDPNKVDVAGDTMTGPLVLPADPATAMQAATKEYVDSHSGGGGGSVTSVAGKTGAVTLVEADIGSLTADLAAKYVKPGTGIPATDLAGAVQTELVLAGTAVQSVTAADATAVVGGTGTAPTVRVGTITESQVTNLTSDLAAKAPLASPALTGTPTGPTAAALTDSTVLATTAYTDAAVAVETSRAETAEAAKLAAASNLSDVASAATALGNLGGVPATRTVTAGTGLTGGGDLSANRSFAVSYGATAGTAAQGNDSRLGLASTSVQSVTAGDATITMAGTATAPTVAVGAVPESKVTNLVSDLAAKASLASPAFTGTPTAPTAAALTSNTQLATTAYADSAVGVETTRAQAAEAARQILAPVAQINRGRASVITTYASGHGWTANGFASSNVNDTSDGRLSGQMLTGTTTGNSGNFPTFTKTGASAVSISGNCLRVWVKVDIPTNITAITLRVADTGGIAAGRYISWTALASSGGVYRTNGLIIPPNTWTEMSFSLGSAFTAGSPNLAALTEYRWIVQDNGTACTVHFGGIEMYPALSGRFPNGVVCIGFDDCYAGQYSLAMNLLSSFGYTATIFPIIDQIGAGGSWTLAQLQQMASIGWEVAPHAYTLADHSGWNSLTTAQVAADVAASKAWIAAQGFGLSGMYAYPLGGFNGGFDAAVAPLIQVARTIDSTLLTETLPIGNAQHLRSAAGVGGTGGIGVTTYTTASTGVLALAKAAAALVPITIHDVSSGTSGNINQISIADLTTLVTAINTAGMAVATYGEVLEYAMLGAAPAAPVTAANSTITVSGPSNAQQVAVTANMFVTPAGGSATAAPTTALNHRRDTAANWTTANPTLAAGELAYETDTGLPKLGDGSTTWTALGYAWQVGQRDPRENYLLGWTGPPEYMNSDNPPTAGELYLQRIVVPAAGSITKVYAFVVSAGSGMTSGQNLVGLYDASGNLLATSADVSSVWTSTHVAQITVPSTAVTPGKPFYVAALFNGSGMPQLAGGGQQYWDLPNVGAGVPNWASPTPPYNATAPNHWRFMSYSSGLTALPSTVALNSASPDKAFWFGVA